MHSGHTTAVGCYSNAELRGRAFELAVGCELLQQASPIIIT